MDVNHFRVMLGLSLYLLTTTLLTCGAQEYYVTPTPPPNPNCPSDELCDTLSYYAKNASALIKGRRNVSLLFMNGYHFSETILEISNVDSFTIAGLDPNFDIEIPSTTIGLTQIFIRNGTIFTLKSIAIMDSSLNVSNFQSMINHEMRCQNSILSLRATQVDSVLLTKSMLFSCSWLLYWGYTDEIGYYDPIETAAIGISTNTNIEPTIEISDTDILTESVIFMRLARNGTSSIHLNVSFCMFLETIGLVVTVHTVGQSLPESNLEFTMEHCVMTDNLYGTIIYANTTHNVNVDISDCHFTANANGSKSIEISAIESNINATVRDNVFLGGFCIVNYVVGSAGMLALTVSRCNFSDANLDSIRADMNEGILNALFEDCRFVDGFNLKSELILQDRVIVARANTPHSSIVLRNSIIMNNHFLTGILVTLGPIHMTIDNCTIKDNSAIVSGGLLAVNSNVTLMGDTIFENNTGSTGAAIYLLGSYLILTQDLNLAFINNKAELTGGAIFVTDASNNFGNEIVRVSSDPNPKCFYQLSQDFINSSISKPFVTFVNNTAVLAGDNIYGGALKDVCTVTPSLLTQSFEVQDTVFDFQSLSRSSVSSSPRRVCVCENGEPKCTDMEHIYIKKSITSGEIVSIEVMLVGYDFGTTIGGVFATEVHTAAENGAAINSLGKGEEIQHLDTKKFCTTVNYSVRGKTSTTPRFILTSNNLNAETIMSLIDFEFTKESIKKSIQEFDQFGVIRTNLLYTPIFMSIDILPCPMGLEMDNITGVCNCRTELVTQGITRKCTVENGRTMITRTERNWLRIHNDSYHGLVFEYARRCLYAYCNSIAVDIDPSDPDSQCAGNHSGVLCGGCQEGLSLAIGSARCIDCHDNSHLALILVFIPLGLVLVLLIWILDLTITRGTINGLLFYANVVSINGEIFFVENTGLDDTLNRCLQIAKLFIDWCNLDFGIESCFIYRLNAMGKIWLQFLFPLYVWTLAGLIIVVCKYSTRLTKLFGSNSVSVLITLFLVAYMKLVQIIIAVFAYADIVDLNGGLIHKVWLVDGNVDYSDLSHIILCLISGILAVFLFAITIWLILIRCTLKVPKHHKIDPILDSFTGRLKKNYEFWIGLSLISRVFLALVTILAHREVVLRILIVVIFILGLVVLNAYKRIYLSLLEVAFLLNLLTVSAVFVGETDNRIRAISISLSVLISALMFLGICIYHGINFVKRVRPKVVKYLKKRLEMKQKHKEAEDEQEEVPKTPTITVVDINSDIELSTDMESSSQKPRIMANYSGYREELLDSTAL